MRSRDPLTFLKERSRVRDQAAARLRERYDATLDPDLVAMVTLHAEPGSPTKQDVLDTLTLLDEIRSRIDHTELGLLDMARRREATWDEIAPAIDVETGRGAESRWNRLRKRFPGFQHQTQPGTDQLM
jgi:hypothetical protein